MGDYTRRPTYKDLQEMVYLERVIKETLRVFTPSLVIGRKLEEEIKIGKYLCPAGDLKFNMSFENVFKIILITIFQVHSWRYFHDS